MMEQRLGATRRAVFMEGVHDGVPIALGYFVVAFTLGILAKTAGLTAWQGFVTSAVNIASAGEYAGFTVIAAQAPYLEIAVLTLVANARYFLMAAALAQRFAPDTPLLHRLAVSFGVTDEVFGITVARGSVVHPYYNYGALAISVPAWSAGTSAGILAGGILPAAAVSALSVALYGMFVWVVLPACEEEPPHRRYGAHELRPVAGGDVRARYRRTLWRHAHDHPHPPHRRHRSGALPRA